MLEFNENNIIKWDKKVVYAANSFGKTTVSNELFEYYNKSGIKTDFFTRKRISQLIAIKCKDVYIGIKARFYKELKDLDEALASVKTAASIFSHTKERTAAKIKENSFYASYIQMKNTIRIPNIDDKIRKKYISLNKYNDSEINMLDISLNYSLYLKIKEFLEKNYRINTKTKVNKKFFSNCLVSDDIFDNLQEIYLYCKLNNVSQCYLCGKHYRNHETLIKSVENRQKSLIRTGNNELYQLYALSLEVIKLANKSNCKILNQILTKTNTIKRQLILIESYYHLCISDASYFQNKLINIKIDKNDDKLEEKTVNDIIRRKNELEKLLSCKNKKEIIATQRYNRFVIKEIKKLINTSSLIEFKPLEDRPGFEFLVNNKKAEPYEYLSESEIKLLSLIVLNAEIKYQHLKVVILDDPIDSYDDYNKRIASNYIASLFKKTSLLHWFIFTNDFECVYFLSQSLKRETIFYMDDIDKVFLGTNNLYEIVAKHTEVGILAKNDLYYLNQFINVSSKKFPYDPDILFCSLTLTIRNLKTDILCKYPDIEINVITKAKWGKNIYEYIESQTEHFDIDNSSNLKISDVAMSFLELKRLSRTSNAKLFCLNNDSFEQYREKIAKSSTPRKNNYTDIVNYLFKKILLINYIKYTFEKKLAKLVHSTFNNDDFNIFNTYKSGLLSRIVAAININNNNGYSIGATLKKYLDIHNEFSTLYNAIDHGTSLVISPYLSVSVKDIMNFNQRVDKL